MSPSMRRAWIEITSFGIIGHRNSSPSTRRAWIEILKISNVFIHLTVALHAEGVDCNTDSDGNTFTTTGSPSTRRVWIEID